MNSMSNNGRTEEGGPECKADREGAGCCAESQHGALTGVIASSLKVLKIESLNREGLPTLSPADHVIPNFVFSFRRVVDVLSNSASHHRTCSVWCCHLIASNEELIL